MKTVTPTELRTNLDRLLAEVLETGVSLEIRKGDETLRIVGVEEPNKLQNLVYRPDVVRGDPDELATLSWR